ncbi:hypothetical protein HDU97_010259 [Phlyctochytrium planicorne]|nr:hypothetical protein HDU97_010259 [Phlyctochytrium planicorne]
MPLYNNTASCYYSQILDCKDRIPGFLLYGKPDRINVIRQLTILRKTGQIFTALAWLSFLFGIVDIVLSMGVKRAKAEMRGQNLPGWFEFSKFEYFMLCFTIVGLLSGIGMSLSVFVNVTSQLFYVIMGTRNVIMFIAVMIYVDMVLATSSFQSKSLERIRTLYLNLLYIPLAGVLGLFLYQGHLSDHFHYVDPSEKFEKYFNLIAAIGIVIWQLCFVLLLIFVIIARRTFSGYLNDVVLPEIAKEKSQAGWSSVGDSKTGSSNGRGRSFLQSSGRKSSRSVSGGKKFKSKSTEIAAALNSGIATLRSIGAGLTIFIIYSLAFTFLILYVGTPNIVYFFTLFVNWCTPFFFGLVIFLVIFHRSISQIRDIHEERSDQWGSQNEDTGVNSQSSATATSSHQQQQVQFAPTSNGGAINPISNFYNPSSSLTASNTSLQVGYPPQQPVQPYYSNAVQQHQYINGVNGVGSKPIDLRPATYGNAHGNSDPELSDYSSTPVNAQFGRRY